MILFYLAVVLGLVYFVFVPRPESYLRTLMKTLPVFLLFLYAISVGAPLLVIAALGLSAVGDALISRNGELAFKLGLWAFLMVLIVYSVIFYYVGTPAIVQTPSWRWLGAALVVLSCGVLLRNLWKPAGPLAPAIASYIAAMLVMGLLSLTMPSPVVFAGAALFLASDALIAMETFTLREAGMKRVASFAVWTFYFIAQCFLTLSLVGIPT